MKIGVYLGKGLPTAQAGGGFTFQHGLLKTLLDTKTEHDFYIFCYHPQTWISENSRVKFIPMSKYFSSSSFSIFKKICLKFLRNSERFYVNKKYGGYLNMVCQQNKIELMWFMTPTYEYVEVPYIYTIWDLQHRFQPYFPEVSVTGSTFEQREAYHQKIIQKAAYIVTGNQEGKSEIELFYSIPDFRVKTIAMPTSPFALEERSAQQNIKFIPKLNLDAQMHSTTCLRPFAQHERSKQSARPEGSERSEQTRMGTSANREHWDHSNPFLFYPAQFWPHKNHVVLLLAVKILKEKFGINFDIVFTGADKGNLNYIKEKAKDLGLQDQAHFLGFVDVNTIIQLYKNAFALVFPSFFGPDNIPPLEAFGLECPVISANFAGARYQMKDAALFFEPGDEVELAEQIKKLYEHPELKLEMVTKGLEIAKDCSCENYIKKIISIADEFKTIRRCWSNTEKYLHT